MKPRCLSLDLALCISSFVINRKYVLSEFCESFLQIIKPEGRDMEYPNL